MQSPKTSPSTNAAFSGMIMDFKLKHSEKADLLMEVTVDGISMDDRFAAIECI